jgi:hypothetical protein
VIASPNDVDIQVVFILVNVLLISNLPSSQTQKKSCPWKRPTPEQRADWILCPLDLYGKYYLDLVHQVKTFFDFALGNLCLVIDLFELQSSKFSKSVFKSPALKCARDTKSRAPYIPPNFSVILECLASTKFPTKFSTKPGRGRR